jgi:hypothetical protein
MNIRGYDAWKLASPDDDPDDVCPHCGAYDTRRCELLEETGGECPWEIEQEDRAYARDEAADNLRDQRSEPTQ